MAFSMCVIRGCGGFWGHGGGEGKLDAEGSYLLGSREEIVPCHIGNFIDQW